MRKLKITSYQKSLLIIPFVLLIVGCSKKVEPPKSVYGQVTTLAGTGDTGSADGKGTAASFNNIWGITVDATDNIYVADGGLNRIRKITPDGVVTTLQDTDPTNNGSFGSPSLYSDPTGVAVDGSGNLFISYFESAVIRKILPDGQSAVFAGNGINDNIDGLGNQASLSQPLGLAVDKSGNIYVAGYSSHSIRKISPEGMVTTLAGSNGLQGYIDGKGSAARFNVPSGVAVDINGNVYVADSGNNMIRKISPDGTVSTFAGSTLRGSANGSGSQASFYYPSGVAIDNNGNVYVADANNNLIRKITPSGLVTTLAGNLTLGSANGVGTSASFSSPVDIALNNEGTLLYVVDRANNLVRQIVIK